MSGDPEQDYFADGISEDIITALSKLSQLSEAFAVPESQSDAVTEGIENVVLAITDSSRLRESSRLARADNFWTVACR